MWREARTQHINAGGGVEPTPVRLSGTSICSNTAWIVFRARELCYLLSFVKNQ